MLDKKHFANCVLKLSILLQVPISEKWPEFMFEELKGYFTNEEFSNACQQIVRSENCYNKMPTIQHFMKYAKRLFTAKSEKEYFLKCVMDFVKAPFAIQALRWEEALSKNLSTIEQKTLMQLGGLSGLWEQVHRRKNPIEITLVQKAISQQYDLNKQGLKQISRETEMLLEDQRKQSEAINQSLDEEKQEILKNGLNTLCNSPAFKKISNAQALNSLFSKHQ